MSNKKVLKKSVVSFLVTIFAVSCSTQIQKVDNSFTTKAISTLIPTPSPSKVLSQKEIDDQGKAIPPTNGAVLGTETVMSSLKKEDEVEGFSYDSGIPNDIPADTTILNIIFKNSHKVRANKENKTVSAINTSQSKKLNEILNKYGVISIGDLRLNNETESKMDQDEIEINKRNQKSEFPNSMSIHRYEFPKGTDFKSLLTELKTVNGIREVYPEGRYVTTSSVTLLARKLAPGSTGSNYPSYSNNQPTDSGFSSYAEDYWYHFRKHRIFESWGLYGTTAMPTIGIIDSGFDVGSEALDKPNYLATGFSIVPQYTSTGNIIANVYTKLSGTSYTQGTTDGHGATVAAVAGSPANNGAYFCGVLPNVPIVPVKVPNFDDSGITTSNYSYYLYQAIRSLADDTVNNVDVISISLAVWGNNVQLPLTSDSTLKSAITYAISKGKVVAIGAGNSLINTDTYTGNYISPQIIATTMPGLLIVGGSESDSITGKNVAWTTYPTVVVKEGSNFGSAIDITASAYNIATVNYNPIANTRGLTYASGTSFATPMVAITAGMIKKINTTLTPSQVKSIIVGTSNLGRYDKGYTNNVSTASYFLGQGLNSTITNPYRSAHIKDLNMFNALIVAKNINNYQAITRVFNTDDNIQGTDSAQWGNWYAYESYNTDSFFGINSLITGTQLNFRTYNTSGGYAYGYQVYKNKALSSEVFDGIAGVYGAQNNMGAPANTFLATKYWNF